MAKPLKIGNRLYRIKDGHIVEIPTENTKRYRMRRGKLVEIPPEWVGKHVWRQTKRKRNEVSRRTRSSKK